MSSGWVGFGCGKLGAFRRDMHIKVVWDVERGNDTAFWGGLYFVDGLFVQDTEANGGRQFASSFFSFARWMGICKITICA